MNGVFVISLVFLDISPILGNILWNVGFLALLCTLERVLTKFSSCEMLPTSCHGSQVCGKGKIMGVNENWLPWQPQNISRLF
jgi:hypothetical protein